MVKKTLIAIALVAFLASTAPAEIEVHYFGPYGNDKGVKVDGKETIRWPYEYKAVDICSMPIKMEIGMYVEVQDCTKKKIVLVQVDCGDIGQKASEFPCYLDCESFAVTANFDVQLGTRLEKDDSGVINKWSAYFDGDDIVPGDGSNHTVKVCVKAWLVNLWKGTPGDAVGVGTLYITAKPAV